MQTEHRQRQEADKVAGDDELADAHGRRLPAAGLIVVGAIGLLGSLIWLLWIGDLRAAPGPAVAGLLAASTFHALGCAGLGMSWVRWSPTTRRRGVIAVVLLGVLLRALAFGIPPTLSDDVYRYRWDGRVQAAGRNPYVEPPASSALAPLRDEEWARINYRRIRSIYPPLAQVLFAATYRLSDTVAGFRLLALVGDLLCVALLLACLGAYSAPRWWLALYACHPLPVVEFASSGHYDAWVASAVLVAVLAHRRGRPVVSTLALAAGMLLKTWPLVFVPLMLRRRPAWHLGLLAGAIGIAYIPYLDAGVRMLQPWLDYTGRWRFNDGVFWVLAGITGSLELAKAIAAAAGLGLLMWLWRRRAEPVRGGYWLLLAFILLMPTIHPWYMLWALPLAALAGDIGWVVLCWLAPTAYWILVGAPGDSAAWTEPWWPRIVEYVPAAMVWAWQSVREGLPYPGRTSAGPRGSRG